jgi:hypothetical protein
MSWNEDQTPYRSYNKYYNTLTVLSEILGFRTLSIVIVIKKHSKNSKNTTFRKLDLFPSSGEGQPTLLGPLERGSLSHRTTDVTDHTSYKHLRPG